MIGIIRKQCMHILAYECIVFCVLLLSAVRQACWLHHPQGAPAQAAARMKPQQQQQQRQWRQPQPQDQACCGSSSSMHWVNAASQRGRQHPGQQQQHLGYLLHPAAGEGQDRPYSKPSTGSVHSMNGLLVGLGCLGDGMCAFWRV